MNGCEVFESKSLPATHQKIAQSDAHEISHSDGKGVAHIHQRPVFRPGICRCDIRQQSMDMMDGERAFVGRPDEPVDDGPGGKPFRGHL